MLSGAALAYAGRVGPGFWAAEASALCQGLSVIKSEPPPLAGNLSKSQLDSVHWVLPRLVAQVAHRGWTQDNLLRHATFNGIRGDKTPVQVRCPASLDKTA